MFSRVGSCLTGCRLFHKVRRRRARVVSRAAPLICRDYTRLQTPFSSGSVPPPSPCRTPTLFTPEQHRRYPGALISHHVVSTCQWPARETLGPWSAARRAALRGAPRNSRQSLTRCSGFTSQHRTWGQGGWTVESCRAGPGYFSGLESCRGGARENMYLKAMR